MASQSESRRAVRRLPSAAPCPDRAAGHRVDHVQRPRIELPAAEPLGQPRRLHRARLRGPLPVGVGRTARRVDPRIKDYARANASIGINGTVLNNVNASPQFLTRPYLEKVAALARVLRPYGIRVYLSANSAAPGPRRSANGRPARPGRCAMVARQGRRDLPPHPRLRRVPRQGQQRGAAGAAGLRADARRRRQRAGRRAWRRTAASSCGVPSSTRRRRPRPREAGIPRVRAPRRPFPRQRHRAGEERPARLPAHASRSARCSARCRGRR